MGGFQGRLHHAGQVLADNVQVDRVLQPSSATDTAATQPVARRRIRTVIRVPWREPRRWPAHIDHARQHACH